MRLVLKVTEKVIYQKKTYLTLGCVFLFLKLSSNKTQFGTFRD